MFLFLINFGKSCIDFIELLKTRINSWFHAYGKLVARNPVSILSFSSFFIFLCCIPYLHCLILLGPRLMIIEFLIGLRSGIKAVQLSEDTLFKKLTESNRKLENNKSTLILKMFLINLNFHPNSYGEDIYNYIDNFHNNLHNKINSNTSLKAIWLSTCHPILPREDRYTHIFNSSENCYIASPIHYFQAITEKSKIHLKSKYEIYKKETDNLKIISFGSKSNFENIAKILSNKSYNKNIRFSITLLMKNYNSRFIKDVTQIFAANYSSNIFDYSYENSKGIEVYSNNSISIKDILYIFCAYFGILMYLKYSMNEVSLLNAHWLFAIGLFSIISLSSIMALSICHTLKFIPTNIPISYIFPYSLAIMGIDNSCILIKSIMDDQLSGTSADRVANGLGRIGYTIFKNTCLNIICLIIANWSTSFLHEFCLYTIVLVVINTILMLSLTLSLTSIYMSILEFPYIKTLPFFQGMLICLKSNKLAFDIQTPNVTQVLPKFQPSINNTNSRSRYVNAMNTQFAKSSLWQNLIIVLIIIFAIYGVFTQYLMELFEMNSLYFLGSDNYDEKFHHTPQIIHDIARSYYSAFSFNPISSILFIPTTNIYYTNFRKNELNYQSRSKLEYLYRYWEITSKILVWVCNMICKYWFGVCFVGVISTFYYTPVRRFVVSLINCTFLQYLFPASVSINDISIEESPFSESIMKSSSIEMIAYTITNKYIVSTSILSGIYISIIDEVVNDTEVRTSEAIDLCERRQIIYITKEITPHGIPNAKFCTPAVWCTAISNDMLFAGCDDGSFEIYHLDKRELICYHNLAHSGIIVAEFKNNIVYFCCESGLLYELKLQENYDWTYKSFQLCKCCILNLKISQNLIGCSCVCGDSIVIMDSTTPAAPAKFLPHSKISWLCADIYSDGIFISGHENGEINVYNYYQRICIYNKKLSRKPLTLVHLTRNFICITDQSVLMLLDRTTFIRLFTFSLPEIQEMVCCAQNILVLYCKNRELILIDTMDCEIIGRISSFSDHKPNTSFCSSIIAPKVIEESNSNKFLVWSSWTCSLFHMKELHYKTE